MPRDKKLLQRLHNLLKEEPKVLPTNSLSELADKINKLEIGCSFETDQPFQLVNCLVGLSCQYSKCKAFSVGQNELSTLITVRRGNDVSLKQYTPTTENVALKKALAGLVKLYIANYSRENERFVRTITYGSNIPKEWQDAVKLIESF